MRAIHLVLLVIPCVILACSGREPASEKAVVAQSPEEAVTVMTFNVQNLFDNRDDKDKSDETYLPREKKTRASHRRKCRNISNKKWRRQCLDWDWSDEVVKKKLERVGEVIRSAGGGDGPELVVLQEVENRRILNMLRNGPLKDLGYRRPILIEGDDKRGIDVAILTKLRLMEKPELHKVPFVDVSDKRKEDSRGILQATLALPNNKWLTVFAVHFPAPFHPRSLRVQSMTYLNMLKKKLPEGRLVLAAGDFNIPSDEAKEYGFFEKLMNPDWIVPHKVNCKGCKGTYYYRKGDQWSFLDMILISKNFGAAEAKLGWNLLPESVKVWNKSAEQNNTEGFPKPFDPQTLQGVSDHWPLVIDLAPTRKAALKQGEDQDKP